MKNAYVITFVEKIINEIVIKSTVPSSEAIIYIITLFSNLFTQHNTRKFYFVLHLPTKYCNLKMLC